MPNVSNADIRDILKTLSEIAIAQNSIQNDVASAKEDISEIKSELNGNGKPGLKQDVIEIQKSIFAVKLSVKVLWYVGGGIATASGVIVAVIKLL